MDGRYLVEREYGLEGENSMGEESRGVDERIEVVTGK